MRAMDELPKKRAYWQVHLSTALIVMIVGGALLPLVIKQVHANADAAAQVVRARGTYPAETATGWSVALVLSYLLILLGNGSVSEFIIRRREGRKP